MSAVFLQCRRVFAVGVFVVAAPVLADRIPYKGTRDIVAYGTTVVVRHHHDWSRIPRHSDGWHLQYSVDKPFGIDADTSNLEFYSSSGALLIRVSSPPLTHLEVSGDGRYVIGLSNIKHLNRTQLVVFNPRGDLLARRRISAHVYCFDAKGYQQLKSKHPEAFLQLESYSQHAYEFYGWREGDRVYLDINGGVVEPNWPPLWDDLYPAMCDSPLSSNFSETVTNQVFWYHDTDPQPRVIERDGRPLELRLRDPKGAEFGIKFEPTLLTAQSANPREK